MVIGAIAVPSASADSVSDQREEVKQVVAELDRMHEKVDQLNEDYVGYLNQKQELDGEIAISQQKIADQQAQLSLLQSQLANVAVTKVMGGADATLGPLFTDPGAIDDQLQRDHLASVAVNAGSASTDDYETLLDELNQETQALQDKQQRALDLAQQAEDSRVKAEDAAATLEDRLAKEQAKLGDLIEEEEQRQAAAAQAAYEKQVAEAQAKAQASAAASGSSSASGGGGGGGGSTSSGGGGSGGGSSDSSGGGGGSVPPVSSRASVAINAAMGQIGVPYHFASSSPGVAFDCSGLTAYAWGVAGVGLPHQSASQYASVPHVPKEQAQPGDLIFFYTPISHVGIYLGSSSMVHAPRSGETVSITAVRWDNVVGVGRPG
jgi:peptidoglycan DL-endopeptidase CwlO